MRLRSLVVGTALVLLAAIAVPLAAASPIPTGSLVFRDPTGIVGPTDSIPVWMSLTLNAGEGGLATDSSGNIVGLTLADIQQYNPAYALDTFTSNVNVAFGCSGTFTSSCITGPPYNFGFAFNAPGDPPAMTWPADLSLPDGGSMDYLFGTFSPTGPVAPGTYFFYYSSVFVQVRDHSGNWDSGNPWDPSYVADIPIANTPGSGCQSSAAGCQFERTVRGSNQVPEPGSTMWLLGMGLAAILRMKRR
jgi:hypothetical protein